ncbi:MAG: hypothetical protein CUN55_10925 [Phototrophicales bacterium]|nr:MAG: hypothetical protein CUN55_10925 [Phototrophicales bacterium]
MNKLEAWLRDNLDYLIESSATHIVENITLQAHAVELVETFFHELLNAVRSNNVEPLQVIMQDWVQSTSFPINEDGENYTSGVINVLVVFKHVILERIRSTIDAEQAINLIMAVDEIFSELKMTLASLETQMAINKLRKQLKSAHEELENLDRSKTNFISVAAHELRTPITVMEGYLRIARSMIDNEDVINLLDGVDVGIQRLLEIISDMIDVSRIELDLLQLHFQPVTLPQIITVIERDISEALEERDLSIHINHETIPDEPTYADPTRLRQAIKNVVFNAIKFTPDGGKIKIFARQLPSFVDLIVEDTGIGIAPSQMAHLFDAFSAFGDASLHSSGKHKFKGGGPGLGLCIAKGILENHGGNIWSESPGYDEETCPGSVFHLMIPLRNFPPEPEDNYTTVSLVE